MVIPLNFIKKAADEVEKHTKRANPNFYFGIKKVGGDCMSMRRKRAKRIRNYFVVYHFTSKLDTGYGNVNVRGHGIRCWENAMDLIKSIEQSLIQKGKVSEDVSVAIINWKEYDL